MEFTKEEILRIAGNQNKANKSDDYIIKLALGMLAFFSVYVWNTQVQLKTDLTTEKTSNQFLKQKVDSYDTLLADPRFTKEDNDRADVPTIKQLNQNTVRINEIQDDLQKLNNNDLKLEYRLETLENK